MSAEMAPQSGRRKGDDGKTGAHGVYYITLTETASDGEPLKQNEYPQNAELISPEHWKDEEFRTVMGRMCREQLIGDLSKCKYC